MSDAPPTDESPIETLDLRTEGALTGLRGSPRRTNLVMDSRHLDLGAVAAAGFPALNSILVTREKGAEWRVSPGLLPALPWLHLYDAGGLSDLRGFDGLPAMMGLMINRAHQLQSLRGLEVAELGDLTVDRAWALESIGAALPTVKKLRLREVTRLPSLAGLEQMTTLRELVLEGADSLVDLAPLRGHPTLQRVEIDGAARLQSLAGLRGLPALKEIWIHGTPALAELGIGELPDLELLYLRGALGLPGWGALAGLPRLRVIRLVHARTLADLAPLAALPALTKLHLTDCPQVDVQTIPPLPHLDDLALSGPKNLDARALIAARPTLKSLSVNGCGFGPRQIQIVLQGGEARLAAAEPGLKAAEWTTVREALSALLGIAPLDAAIAAEVGRGRWMLRHSAAPLVHREHPVLGHVRPELRETAALWLAALIGHLTPTRLRVHPEVLELPPMARFTQLAHLKLRGCNHLGDLAPLAGLSALETLVLDHTPVRDLRPLRALPRLRHLDLLDCPNLPPSFRRRWEGEAVQNLLG